MSIVYRWNYVRQLGFVVISASNSNDDAKKSSDFVCTGKNDEKVIQKALDICVKESKNIFYIMVLTLLKIFDTDLNKEVICIDVKNKKWVDLLGNEV